MSKNALSHARQRLKDSLACLHNHGELLLQVSDIFFVDAAVRIRMLCVLIQIVAAALQESHQFLDLLQIQMNAVAIQCHFSDVGTHIVDTDLFHLIVDSVPIIL